MEACDPKASNYEHFFKGTSVTFSARASLVLLGLFLGFQMLKKILIFFFFFLPFLYFFYIKEI